MLKEPSRGWQTRQRMRLKVSKRSSRGSRTARQQFFVSTEELSTEERNYICVIKILHGELHPVLKSGIFCAAGAGMNLS
jgi:hypothetical protein